MPVWIVHQFHRRPRYKGFAPAQPKGPRLDHGPPSAGPYTPLYVAQVPLDRVEGLVHHEARLNRGVLLTTQLSNETNVNLHSKRAKMKTTLETSEDENYTRNE